MASLQQSASPYAHGGSRVSIQMLNVCLALLPATLFGFYLFGWPALFLFVVTCVSAICTELVCLYWLRHPLYRVFDSSALLTGWLLAMTLPPWAPWWLGVLGGFFAIAIGKQLYGGLGQNIFNPAMLARTALLITFPVQMTAWVAPLHQSSLVMPGFVESLAITFSGAASIDGYTAATPLGGLKTALAMDMTAAEALAGGFSLKHAVLGISAGSMAETSAILLLVGGLFLLWRKVIQWEIPVSLLATLALLTLVAKAVNPDLSAGPWFHLASGGLMLGAFFIATDPVTSPVGRLGKVIFGIGCAVVIFVIRIWGSFPEAVAFAVLFMNGFTPLIDRYFKPRRYGRYSNGKPLPQLSSVELAREAQKR